MTNGKTQGRPFDRLRAFGGPRTPGRRPLAPCTPEHRCALAPTPADRARATPGGIANTTMYRLVLPPDVARAGGRTCRGTPRHVMGVQRGPHAPFAHSGAIR